MAWKAERNAKAQITSTCDIGWVQASPSEPQEECCIAQQGSKEAGFTGPAETAFRLAVSEWCWHWTTITGCVSSKPGLWGPKRAGVVMNTTARTLSTLLIPRAAWYIFSGINVRSVFSSQKEDDSLSQGKEVCIRNVPLPWAPQRVKVNWLRSPVSRIIISLYPISPIQVAWQLIFICVLSGICSPTLCLLGVVVTPFQEKERRRFHERLIWNWTVSLKFHSDLPKYWKGFSPFHLSRTRWTK